MREVFQSKKPGGSVFKGGSVGSAVAVGSGGVGSGGISGVSVTGGSDGPGGVGVGSSGIEEGLSLGSIEGSTDGDGREEALGSTEGLGDIEGDALGSTEGEGEGEPAGFPWAIWSLPPLQVLGIFSLENQP